MKQFRFLTMAALIAFGTAVCAQNVITLDEMQARKKQQQQQPQQQQVVQEKVSYSSASDYESFGTLFLQYNPSQIHASYDGHSSNSSVNAVSLGYLQSIPMGDIGLYLEFGGALQYFFKSEDMGGSYYGHDDDYYDWDDWGYDDFGGSSHDKAKFSMLSLKIPFNVMYSFNIGDAVSIQPYAGVYGRINLFAQTKVGDEKIDHFNKDDMKYVYGEAWKRFQFGVHGGVKARFVQKFAVGVGYYLDVAKLMEHTTIRGFDISLGFTF